MTMHTQSPIQLSDAATMKRDLQILIRNALDAFYEETGLSVDNISIEAMATYCGSGTIVVKHIVSLEVML